MSSLVFGTVERVTPANTSANANPAHDVTIVTVDDGAPYGRRAETFRTSADASVAYGIGNPEYRERVHAFRLTAAGRILELDHDATAAYRRLVEIFPRGSRVSTLTDRSASVPRVRILAADRAGVVDDVSYAVAAVTRSRTDRKRGGVIVPGVGTEPAAHVVHSLSRVLYGTGDALSRHQV